MAMLPMAKKAPEGEAAAGDEDVQSSLTEKAYRTLEELIVTLALPPGSVVSEAALSQQLGIGRTPIREALQRLAREHLVTILPRRGIIVSEVNIKTQLRLLEVRRELERLMSRAAAKRATVEERAEFRRIAEGMQEAAAGNDDIAFMRLDRAFNLLTAHAARNDFATGAIALMQSLSRRFWYIHYKQVADMPLAARLHGAVALAIAEGDPARAAASSDALMDYIEDFTRATIAAD